MIKTFNTKLAFSFSLLLCFTLQLFAQSAPNLVTDVAWDSDPNTSGAQSTVTSLAGILNAYNNGRRQEEIQKSLPTNSLGNLTLPADWNTAYTPFGKVFFLVNAERSCRGGMDYDGAGGIPAVLGLSFEQVSTTLNTVAQDHANWLVINDLFQHTGISNSTPFARIQAAFPMNSCSEFLSRGENIAFFASTANTVTAAIEKAVYNWIYNDSGSAWGQREASLLQNMDLAGTSYNGFKNNFGGSLSEGMIGVGVAGENGGGYIPSGYILSGMDRTEVVVLVLMDPTADATATANNCDYAAATVLPIELAQFSAKQEGESIVLYWKTAFERDNSHFMIERASNGKDFEEIGRVDGFGESQTERSYRFKDENVASGTHYYRLMQYDNSRKATASQVVAVRYFEQLNLSVYPNSEGILMSFSNTRRSEGTYEITDINGISLQKGDLDVESGFNRIQKPINDLPNGLYFLTLEINGVREVVRFVW
jgi:hypothetical protein